MVLFYAHKVSLFDLLFPLFSYIIGSLFVPFLFYILAKGIRQQIFLGWQIKENQKFWRTLFEILPLGMIAIGCDSSACINNEMKNLLLLQNNTKNELYDKEFLKTQMSKIKKRNSNVTLSDTVLSQSVSQEELKEEQYEINNEKETIQLAVSTINHKYGETNHKIVILQNQSAKEELIKKKNILEQQKAFFAMIIHELRNPLHGMLGILEMLKISNLPLNITKDCILGINTGKLMMSLINDILDISQIEANKFKLNDDAFSPLEALNDCMDVMQFKFDEKHVALVRKITGQIPEIIQSDKNRFKQILFNLLGNALKFTTEGFVEVEVSFEREQKKLITKVTDTGTGIKEEHKPLIFQMYATINTSQNLNPQGINLINKI